MPETFRNLTLMTTVHNVINMATEDKHQGAANSSLSSNSTILLVQIKSQVSTKKSVTTNCCIIISNYSQRE